MEALTAVAIAALTIYDMCKAVDKQMVIGDIAPARKIKVEFTVESVNISSVTGTPKHPVPEIRLVGELGDRG